MDLSANRLTELLQPLVEDLGYVFVGLEYQSSPKHAVLRIYIDREDGVDIDDCSRVSHEVAALLDVEDPISGQYNLEISSPGLDRPLFTREQFEQFAGEQAQVSLYAPEGGRRNFKGRILGVEDDSLMLEQDGAEIVLHLNNIAKARLVPDYEKLMSGKDRRQA
jgi:ribosome maturation factor RimP